MISKAKTVDAFLANLGEDEKSCFAKVRQLLRQQDGVEESMKYGMPTYLRGNEPFGAFNKQKAYLCVYLDPKAIDPFRKELKSRGLDCGKSCIRFRKPSDLPLDLITQIIAASS